MASPVRHIWASKTANMDISPVANSKVVVDPTNPDVDPDETGLSKQLLPRRGNKTTMSTTKRGIVLMPGEFFVEYPDSGVGTKGKYKIKIGDGKSVYADLPYAFGDTDTDQIEFYDDTSMAGGGDDDSSGSTFQEFMDGIASGASTSTLFKNIKGAMQNMYNTLSSHLSNMIVHITAEEREKWNTVSDYIKLENGSLDDLVTPGQEYYAEEGNQCFNIPSEMERGTAFNLRVFRIAPNVIGQWCTSSTGFNFLRIQTDQKWSTWDAITSSKHVQVNVEHAKNADKATADSHGRDIESTYASSLTAEVDPVTSELVVTPVLGNGQKGQEVVISDVVQKTDLHLGFDSAGNTALVLSKTNPDLPDDELSLMFEGGLYGKYGSERQLTLGLQHEFDASDVKTGVFDIERLPHGALERLIKVQNDGARFALTKDDVQNGDTVYVLDTFSQTVIPPEIPVFDHDSYFIDIPSSLEPVSPDMLTTYAREFQRSASFIDDVSEPNTCHMVGTVFYRNLGKDVEGEGTSEGYYAVIRVVLKHGAVNWKYTSEQYPDGQVMTDSLVLFTWLGKDPEECKTKSVSIYTIDGSGAETLRHTVHFDQLTYNNKYVEGAVAADGNNYEGMSASAYHLADYIVGEDGIIRATAFAYVDLSGIIEGSENTAGYFLAMKANVVDGAKSLIIDGKTVDISKNKYLVLFLSANQDGANERKIEIKKPKSGDETEDTLLTTITVETGSCIFNPKLDDDPGGEDRGILYLVIDDNLLNSPDGYVRYATGRATSAIEAEHALVADRLSNSRTFTLSGEVTGQGAFDGTGDTMIISTLSDTTVNAGTYGETQESVASGGTLKIPRITFDKKGRATGAVTQNVKLPVNVTTSTAGFMSPDNLKKLNALNIAYGTCNTAAGTASKVVTLAEGSQWSMVQGAVIAIKFSATNTAQNPRLNVGGTGDRPIYYNTAVVTTASLSMVGTANRITFYMYDGENYVWLGWTFMQTYSALSFGIGYGTASIVDDQTTLIGVLSGYNLATNGIIALKFANAIPAGAKLNVNSRGAKPIWHKGAAIAANVVKAGDTATFIYDGTHYVFISIDTTVPDVVPKAEQLNTARKISIAGDATGNTTFDGSKDVTINVTLSDFGELTL